MLKSDRLQQLPSWGWGVLRKKGAFAVIKKFQLEIFKEVGEEQAKLAIQRQPFVQDKKLQTFALIRDAISTDVRGAIGVSQALVKLSDWVEGKVSDAAARKAS